MERRRAARTPSEGVVWRRRAAGAVAAALVLAVGLAVPVRADGPPVRVIVAGEPGAVDQVHAAVGRFGGTVGAELGVVDGVAAEVPAGALAGLRAAPGVRSVTADRAVSFAGAAKPKGKGFAPVAQDDASAEDFASLNDVTRAIGAHSVWAKRITGQGVGVALIDSGVVPVQGLDAPGKVVNGPDLSFDSQVDTLRYLDGYGHGTHMAGIIAGRDAAAPPGAEKDPRYFAGVAPGAHLVNVKAGATDGSVDVSQVIAAVDWVVEHRRDPGRNIRVLNLSFGTDSLQDPRLDPLSYAVEVAWKKGIVVVVSGGNDGRAHPRLADPAVNPYVIAVGAADLHGTDGPGDDTVPDFSSRGAPERRVDLVAPGKSVVSLRAPGSVSDLAYPSARVGERFFRGSGTSQAAAVVSGAAALLLEQRPTLTPDQVKHLLVSTVKSLPRADPEGRGAGLLDVRRASKAAAPRTAQTWPAGSGTGSLELARGGAYVTDGDIPLVGELDIFGRPWSSAIWAPAAAGETAWNGGHWLGAEYTGSDWSGTSWASATWQARSWRTGTWAARSWRTGNWAARSWRSGSWSGGSWSTGGL